jgi:heterodisulfide reductase subunit B
MKIETTEQEYSTKELLPQIIDRIFSICRVDPSFHLKDELEILENKMEAILSKLEKQNKLLKQASDIKKDLEDRIEIMKDSNSRKQNELLENLGSE